MRILGMDQSLTYTALSWMADGQHRWSSIISKPMDNPIERLASIRTRYLDFAHNMFQGEERCLLVEGMSYGSKGRALFQLGWLGFQIRIDFHYLGWHIVDVPPKTLKAYVTDNGNADKKLMMEKIKERWFYEAPNDNVADAYALMKFGDDYLPWVRGADMLPPSKRVAKLFGKLSMLKPASII